MLTTDEGLRIRTTKSVRSPSGGVTCSGQMTAAADVAPEPLVGMVERAGSSWMFVGERGNLYESEGPMESFRRVIGAPTTFARVVGSGKTVLAVTPWGELFRLDDASTWQPVNVPAARIYDVAVADDGRALGLALPEKFFTSSDGQKFVEAPNIGTIGARRVGRTPKGALGVQGVTGTIVWEPNASPPLVQASEPISPRGSVLELDAVVVPTATAVVEGRATLDGDRYVEAVLLDEENGNWSLASGSFEGPLATTSLPDTSECAGMRVGARGRFVSTVCIKTDDDGNYVGIVRMSSDGGRKFGEPARFAAGDGELLGVAVANDGTTLVTGICKARTGQSGCSGSPPVLIRTDKGAVTTTLAVAPPLMGLPISPAFSVDGRSAYFLARRAKDERLALFVSHDGGRTFTERALDARAGRAPTESFEEYDESSDDEPTEESLDPSDLTTLRPSDDGTLGMVLTTSRGLSYFTTDEDGRVVGVSRPPVDQAIMGGYGQRVIALALASDRTPSGEDAITAWESADGGSNWNELSVTRSVVREIVTGPMTAACASAGCLVGTTIARVGWNGQSDPPPVTNPKAPDMHKINAVRTPILCTLDPKTSWKQIGHVWSNFALPTLSDTARGRVLWSVLSFDPGASAVSTTLALLPEKGNGPARVTTRSLFGPAPKGVKYAVDVTYQIEGYAAARVRLPEGDRVAGPMRNVEIAWENFVDGTSKRATIPDAGEFTEGDVKSNDERHVLDTGLLSVAAGAIFVRPHSRDSSDARMFLLDAKGKRSTHSYPDWQALLKFGKTNLRSDSALVDGTPMAVGTVDDFDGDAFGPLTMVLAHAATDGSWKTTATSLIPLTSKDRLRLLSHDWTYRGGTEVGVAAITSEPRAGRAAAMFLPFRADGSLGAPQELPTPYDLPAMPRPCKADERRATPRLGAPGFPGGEPMFPGHRHPVLVTEAQKDKPALGEALVLLTSGVVLHGTKDAPCVAAWDAFGIAPMGIGAVIAGDPSQAWLFRRARDPASIPGLRMDVLASRSENVVLEYRPMSCRFDATATIPETVWAQPGTFRWSTK